MARKLKREVDLLNSRQLAMDRELQKLSKYNKDTIVDIAAEVCYLSSEAMLLDAQSFFYHNLSFVQSLVVIDEY